MAAVRTKRALRHDRPNRIYRHRPHRSSTGRKHAALQGSARRLDVDPEPLQAVVEKGAVRATSVAEVARTSDVVGICVPADDHVRSVLDGPDGLLANLSEGALVAIHSTVLPETATWAAGEAAQRGIRIVEVCLTGGHFAAAEGRTTFLLGGDPADIAALEPVLSACGETLVQAGPLGNANLLKLCLNLQTYVSHLRGRGCAAGQGP